MESKDDKQAQRKALLRLVESKPPAASPTLQGKPGRVGKAASGLTLKQEAFAVEIAKGATNAEAYRAAYNCDGMAQTTVWQEGCKLAQHPKVAERVEALLREKQAKTQLVEAKASERIWRQVWSVLEGDDTPAAVKVSAAALAAKLAGMMVDKLEVKGPETPEAIERELAQRLARYK